MSTVIGIDLGTSTTEAAILRNGKPEMILNFEGDAITPSVIGVDASGAYVFGKRAKAQYLMEPENTVIEVKRKIGSGETILMGGKKYTPAELSALLLKHVKDYVEEFLEEEIDRAVISVPAYFDDLQRQEVVKAGKQAGFSVERIINEPTAAALSYGMEHMEEESHILVYDLGGGTFDVTLLEMFGGVLEVKASSGDNQLGGKDFDECLIQWLADQFRLKHGINLLKNDSAMVKLKEQAEQCKIHLSTEPSWNIEIPFIAQKDGQPLALMETITAEQFEKLTDHLVKRTHRPIDVVLSDSGIQIDDIQRILLVGGSTRMPMIARDIENYLGRKPERAVNPDYAVAEGASVMAAIIQGSLDDEDSLIMTDVSPFSLGVKALKEFDRLGMSVIIPRNITIPTSRSQVYYTSADGQESAEIEVYQGESPNVEENHFLGKFTISGIPWGFAGDQRIRVQFSYNLNGMLDVEATIESTGEHASVEISLLNQKPEKEEDRKPEETDTVDGTAVDPDDWQKAPEAKRFRTVIRRAERRLKSEAIDELPLYRIDLEEALYELKVALVQGNISEAEDLEDEILDLLQSK